MRIDRTQEHSQLPCHDVALIIAGVGTQVLQQERAQEAFGSFFRVVSVFTKNLCLLSLLATVCPIFLLCLMALGMVLAHTTLLSLGE